MKSFADVKRRMVPGAILECVSNTYRPELDGTQRRVEVVQTNAVAFQRPQADGSFLPSIPRKDLFWFYYPKSAKDVAVAGDQFTAMIGTSGHTLTLRFVEG